MGNNEIGEHSRKTSNSNNSDSERPFKKARYVWQLKGKYHLKDTYKQATNNPESKETSSSYSEEHVVSDSESININNNNSESQNNNCNKCCLDTLLARSNALLETEDSNDPEIWNTTCGRSISDEIPVTLVNPNPKSHDDFLQKWQARQVAKSYVDNTINSILEQWKLAPVDAADFVENCDNGGQIEDEGILMAIQSHGLHHSRLSNIPRAQNQNGEASHSSSCDYMMKQKAQAPSFIHMTSYIDKSAQDNFENVQNEMVKQRSVSNLDILSNYSDDGKNNANLENNDPMDFISAAVSMAIQNKGLSSYSYG